MIEIVTKKVIYVHENYFKNVTLKIKSKAQQTLYYARRNGKIQKLSCEKCGNKKSQAHHENYKKPLDVIWLCASCHRKRHIELNKTMPLKRKIITKSYPHI